jgi:hypothetical protein
MRRSVRNLILLRHFPSFNFYVNNLIGNDNNDGRTENTPKATLAAATAAVGTTPNQSIGIARGTVYRGERIASSAPGLTVDAYGSSDLAKPLILGSTRIAGSWTNVSGNIYASALAYTPVNVFWQTPAGVVTKLRLGTAGALTANQWAVTGGNLQVNIGKDPTTEYIEVCNNISTPTGNPLAYGVVAGAAGQIFRNVSVRFWPGSGASTDQPNSAFTDGDYSYNGNDGIDTSGTATAYIARNTIIQNGTTRNSGGGPGDGISCHAGTVNLIEGNTLLNNEGTGIGNEADCTCVCRYNYLSGNYANYQVYNDGGAGTTGSHKFYYNEIYALAADGFAVNISGGSNSGVVHEINNNTIYGTSGMTATSGFLGGGFLPDCGITCSAPNATVRNNIVRGFRRGIERFAGNTDTDYNVYDVFEMYHAGSAPNVQGAHDIKALSGMIDPANGNYDLTLGSVATSSGVSLGYTNDFRGTAVPATPCRGALERLS